MKIKNKQYNKGKQMKFYRLKNKQMPWGDYGEIK